MASPGPLARAWRWFVGPRASSLEEYLEEEVSIALHVARHEAAARHQPISPLHLLYGLLQDEGFVEAMASAGGNAAAIEDRVLRDLEALEDAESEELVRSLSITATFAHHHGRRATRADVWNWLGRTSAARPLEAAGVGVRPLLFVLTHGRNEPALPLTATPEVDVIFRNDDFTTMELVVTLLHDIFGMPHDKAHATMLAVHEQGSAVVGRCASEIARERVRRARTKATEHGAPLWIEIANV